MRGISCHFAHLNSLSRNCRLIIRQPTHKYIARLGIALDSSFQPAAQFWQEIVVDRGIGSKTQPLVRRGAHRPGIGRVFFQEFLARSQSGELDTNSLLGEPSQADHAPNQIDNLHRLAHLHNINFAPLANRPRLENQLRSLRKRDKAACHLGVRNGYRAAPCDLPLEPGNQAARGAEHVAKTYDFEPSTDSLPV